MRCRNRLRCVAYINRLGGFPVQSVSHHLHCPLFAASSRHDKLIAQLVESFTHRARRTSEGAAYCFPKFRASRSIVVA